MSEYSIILFSTEYAGMGIDYWSHYEKENRMSIDIKSITMSISKNYGICIKMKKQI